MNKFLILFLCFLSMPATAKVTIEVMDTFPATERTLAVDQEFYVHFVYTSDKPVRLFVRPYTNGKDSNAISHPAVTLPAGFGETLGWFAMRTPGVVDEYRISADTTNSGRPETVLTVPITLEWKPGGVMTNSGHPEWIERINQRNEEIWLAEQEKAAQELSDSGKGIGIIVMAVLFGIPLLTLALCVLAVVRWQGKWRYAGGVPLALFAIWLVLFSIDVTRDPTSHNLWPFELLIGAGFTLVWLLAWFIVRKVRKN